MQSLQKGRKTKQAACKPYVGLQAAGWLNRLIHPNILKKNSAELRIKIIKTIKIILFKSSTL